MNIRAAMTSAALLASITACSDQTATPDPTTTHALPAINVTIPSTTPPPEYLEDCGVVHQYGPTEEHAVRGSANIDCAEARRVGKLWYATPSGRSAGYYVTFENWECIGGNANEYLTRCVRSDSAVVYLRIHTAE
ncbi:MULTISPECIES: hypothetical protein [unclassified Mycobacterium]|uniref:hypothetical protein n=1 Tax=Mycobacterium sp. DL99 TaxID=2528957 RepID=UPI00108147C4|nr:hypothetical protein [Mycobacterium sp. DL99]